RSRAALARAAEISAPSRLTASVSNNVSSMAHSPVPIATSANHIKICLCQHAFIFQLSKRNFRGRRKFPS
ncbi:MAG: hypothetical protein QMD99_13465, partial [Rhizobiaceae bacterium]|nr:hypothetical protein [Rhizobiaceae bacterium]